MSRNFNITKLTDLDHCIMTLQRQFSKGVLYLHGDLGSGKTTFVSHWLSLLGYNDIVTSPTYMLVNEYHFSNYHILHADLYRLIDPEELLYLDVTEWKDRAQLIFVEWPSHGIPYLPKADKSVWFYLQKNNRQLIWYDDPVTTLA